MDLTPRIERIQRWIGSPQSGNLNDEATVKELERDIVGLHDYLVETGQIEVIEPSGPKLTVSDFPERHTSTPNKSGTIQPKGVIFHHSEGNFDGSVSWIKDPKSRVSYHVMIDLDGSRVQFVPLNKKAWHCNPSYFKGRSRCNDFMLGVGFSGDTNERELTEAEIASAVEFVATHKDQYGWTLDWMTDHRTVSPGRKDDLSIGEWKRLQNALKTIF